MTVPKTYDPASVNLVLGGFAAYGFADGNFIELTPAADLYSKTVGSQGEVSRAKINDNTGQLKIILKQTSGYNEILTAFMNADRLNNSGIFPVLCNDSSGTTVIFSAYGWIMKQPTVNFSNSIESREWIIDLSKTDFFIGGNS